MKKKKTEVSYLQQFKEKFEGGSKQVIDEKSKKGINFDELNDWENIKYEKPNMNNANLENNDSLKADEVYSPNEAQENLFVPARNKEVIHNPYYPQVNHVHHAIPQPAQNNVEINDNFSVNTSNFTNRFNDMGNNIDKIELSTMNNNNLMTDMTNLSNKKVPINFTLSSNDNVILQLQKKAQPIEWEHKIIKEEDEFKVNYSMNDSIDLKKDDGKNKSIEKNKEKVIQSNSENNSLNSSGISYKIEDKYNITQNQLNDLNKEMKLIYKELKQKEQEKDKEKDKITKGQQGIKKSGKGKIILDPIGTKVRDQALTEEKNQIAHNSQPKRKQSPYIRQIDIQGANSLPSKNVGNNMETKPISIQTYQQNTNIMLPPNTVNGIQMQVPMYYSNLYGNINYPQFYPQYPMYNNQQGYYPCQIQMPVMNMPPADHNSMFPRDLNKQEEGGSGSGSNRLSPSSPITGKNNHKQESSPKRVKEISYKPKTFKEYKEKYENNNSLKKLSGGLGANIGTKEWEEKNTKVKKIKEYSNLVATINKEKIITEKNENTNAKDISINHISKIKENQKEFISLNKEAEENSLNDSLSVGMINEIKEETRAIKSATPESTANHEKSGYSHIHFIKNLKQENEIEERKSGKKVIPTVKKTEHVAKQNEMSKIYTTMKPSLSIKPKMDNVKRNSVSNLIQEDKKQIKKEKTRAQSGKPGVRMMNRNEHIEDDMTKEFYENNEIENLLQNHNIFAQKVAKIKVFLNKNSKM